MSPQKVDPKRNPAASFILCHMGRLSAHRGATITVCNRSHLNRAIMSAWNEDDFTLIFAVIGKNAYDHRT